MVFAERKRPRLGVWGPLFLQKQNGHRDSFKIYHIQLPFAQHKKFKKCISLNRYWIPSRIQVVWEQEIQLFLTRILVLGFVSTIDFLDPKLKGDRCDVRR